jgi:ABC-type glucose/galactose transport system permease subunit
LVAALAACLVGGVALAAGVGGEAGGAIMTSILNYSRN